MSTYNELIKNFEKVRSYMREFYIYGFKSREEYTSKSLRSYDDEKRRIESWLDDYMKFIRTSDGKNVFLSINSREITHNPLYKALKAKSFTDGDITLHFIIFDILNDFNVSLTINEIMDLIDNYYLSDFNNPMMFDSSTIRKKLNEYCEQGLIIKEKEGKNILYRVAKKYDISSFNDLLNYFSETAPCGGVGSFLLDRINNKDDMFIFKHHYITSALDSEVLLNLFLAMQKKSSIEVNNINRKNNLTKNIKLVPLKVFISVQDGKQYLLAYQEEQGIIKTFRIDYLVDVKIEEVNPQFDELRLMLEEAKGKMWGANIKRNRYGKEKIERVSFTIKIEKNEEFIVKRLEREKRIGKVEKIDDYTYNFNSYVYDTSEMIPWIRTFICRIVKLNFSNRTLENEFKKDIKKMYEIYGVSKNDI